MGQPEQNNHGYKELKCVHMQKECNKPQTEKYWFRKNSEKHFFHSKLQDYIEEGLVFQKISKTKNDPEHLSIINHGTKKAVPLFFMQVHVCKIRQFYEFVCRLPSFTNV